jgi:hypothetical protein
MKGFTLTAQERQDLLDFLSSLTDRGFLDDSQTPKKAGTGSSRYHGRPHSIASSTKAAIA